MFGKKAISEFVKDFQSDQSPKLMLLTHVHVMMYQYKFRKKVSFVNNEGREINFDN